MLPLVTMAENDRAVKIVMDSQNMKMKTVPSHPVVHVQVCVRVRVRVCVCVCVCVCVACKNDNRESSRMSTCALERVTSLRMLRARSLAQEHVLTSHSTSTAVPALRQPLPSLSPQLNRSDVGVAQQWVSSGQPLARPWPAIAITSVTSHQRCLSSGPDPSRMHDSPAYPTEYPMRMKRTAPRMLRRHGTNTPLIVPS
jgi:hypothetical protein